MLRPRSWPLTRLTVYHRPVCSTPVKSESREIYSMNRELFRPRSRNKALALWDSSCVGVCHGVAFPEAMAHTLSIGWFNRLVESAWNRQRKIDRYEAFKEFRSAHRSPRGPAERDREPCRRRASERRQRQEHRGACRKPETLLRGQEQLKGTGGCATDGSKQNKAKAAGVTEKHSCAGKNSCKGNGGCAPRYRHKEGSSFGKSGGP